MIIRYYEIDEVADRQFKYAVIVAGFENKWLFCRQKTRQTYELPAGRREEGESIIAAAERELREETGAVRYVLKPLLAFHVAVGNEQPDDNSPYGLLCLARVDELGPLPGDLEMAEVVILDQMPENLSYPEVQPQLFDLARRSTI